MNYRDACPVNDDRMKKRKAHDAHRPAPVQGRARLYLLSFLLTADRVKAEQCSVAGLDMSGEDSTAIRDWAHSWARRIVINNAIRLIAPHPEAELTTSTTEGCGDAAEVASVS